MNWLVRMANLHMCVLVPLFACSPASHEGDKAPIVIEVVRGLTSWAGPDPTYPGIQMRALCACTTQEVGPLWLDILSAYPGQVTIQGIVSYGRRGSTRSSSFTANASTGLPSRTLILPNLAAGQLISVSFHVLGSLGNPVVLGNSLSFRPTHEYLNFITPTPGFPLLVRAKCLGWSGPPQNEVGHWTIEWLNSSNDTPINFIWSIWAGQEDGTFTSSTTFIDSPGGFSEEIPTPLYCEGPPWDNGIYFWVQKTTTLPIAVHPIPNPYPHPPHPNSSRVNTHEAAPLTSGIGRR